MNKSSERYQTRTPLTIYVHNAQGEIGFCSQSIYLYIYLLINAMFFYHFFGSSLHILISFSSLPPIKPTILFS